MPWYVYIIRASDDSLYTGITTDVDRRIKEHNNKTKGAKYFNGRTAKQIVFCEPGHTRSSATIREMMIKNLSRQEKLKLISKEPQI